MSLRYPSPPFSSFSARTTSGSIRVASAVSGYPMGRHISSCLFSLLFPLVVIFQCADSTFEFTSKGHHPVLSSRSRPFEIPLTTKVKKIIVQRPCAPSGDPRKHLALIPLKRPSKIVCRSSDCPPCFPGRTSSMKAHHRPRAAPNLYSIRTYPYRFGEPVDLRAYAFNFLIRVPTMPNGSFFPSVGSSACKQVNCFCGIWRHPEVIKRSDIATLTSDFPLRGFVAPRLEPRNPSYGLRTFIFEQGFSAPSR